VEAETEREFLSPTNPLQPDAPLSLSAPPKISDMLGDTAHNGDPTIKSISKVSYGTMGNQDE